MEEYDLIVLGAGSGLDVASGYANRGNKVAIVEPGPLGGTCLNRGCIPSKMLIHRADIVEEIHGSEKFGIEASLEDIDFPGIVNEVNSHVSGEASEIREGIESSENIDLYSTEGRFTDEKTVEVDGEKIRGEKIVVAAGSRPFIPPIDGVEEVDYLTSREALQLDEKPSSMIVVGGGYISLELAHFFDSMGVEITILEMGERLLSREEIDVSEKITELASERYSVNLEVSASRIEETDGKKKVVTGSSEEFEAEEVLLATGRVPNTDRVNAEEAGIETTERGFIETDDYMRTSAEDVYALGDIADNWMFKHSANREAQTVFRNIVLEDKHEIGDPVMPHAVFTSPQIAGVGKTGQELEEEDVDYVTSVYEYSDTGMGSALKEEDGFVKVLASGEGEILGCHIIGPEASTLIHEVVVAMESGSGRLEDIKDSIHVHPALNEVVQRAFNQL